MLFVISGIEVATGSGHSLDILLDLGDHVLTGAVVGLDNVGQMMVIGQVKTVHQLRHFISEVFPHTLIGCLLAQNVVHLGLK